MRQPLQLLHHSVLNLRKKNIAPNTYTNQVQEDHAAEDERV